MRKLPPSLLAAMLCVAVAGCGIVYRQPIYQGSLLESSAVEHLQVGMSRQQVEVLLGTPSVSDPFHHDRWDYTATERSDRLGHVEVKNFTVWFENDAVTRWGGDYVPERDVELAKRMAKFGNLAKDDKKK